MTSTAYATAADLKARLDISEMQPDALFTQLLAAASRQIDGWTARTFVAETGAQVLSAEFSSELVLPGDLVSVDELATDDANDRTYAAVWDVTEYELVGDPAYAIHVMPMGGRRFPRGRNRVRITGLWGYSAEPPAPIVEATLLLASRLYKRKDAPFGIAGSADHGELQTLPGMDPDVKQLIQSYRRYGLVGV